MKIREVRLPCRVVVRTTKKDKPSLLDGWLGGFLVGLLALVYIYLAFGLWGGVGT